MQRGVGKGELAIITDEPVRELTPTLLKAASVLEICKHIH